MKNGIIFLLMVAVFPQTLHAATTIQRPGVSRDAEIVSVRGDSSARLMPQEAWEPAVAQQTLTAGDSIKTGAYGKLDLLFIDGTQVKVNHKTLLVIKEVRKPSSSKGTTLGLQNGEIWSRAKSTPHSLKIVTPSATAAIRGTDWDISVDDSGTSNLVVLKGTVELANEMGSVTVLAGESARAESGKPPVKMVLVRPKERVQWISSFTFDVPRMVVYSPSRTIDATSIAELKLAVVRNPADSASREHLAGLLYNSRQLDESLEQFNELLRIEPSNATALTFTGMILLDRGDADGAAARFAKVPKSSDGKFAAEATLGLAGAALQKNNLPRAEVLLAGLPRNTAPAVAGIALASFRAFLGEFAPAVELCREFALRYPGDERFPVLTAEIMLAMDDAPQALAQIEKALAVNPDSSAAHAVRGRYFYLDGKGREAESAYRASLARDPFNSGGLSELGRLLMERGEYEEAKRLLDRVVGQSSSWHSGWSRRGQLLNWLDDLRGAARDFRTAVELNPSDYESLDGLGYQALKEGRPRDAIEMFLKAGTIEPKFAQPHIFLAIAHYQLDEVDRALEELRLAESLDPRDPLPHLIAYIIYSDTYRPFQSIHEAKRALELMPNLKSINPVEKTQEGISNLGASLLGLGMTEWATSYAEESFDPFDASGYFFVSKKYDSNPLVYVSENVQGFLMDPLAIGQHYRYQDIVARPYNNLRVNTTIADEGGSFTHIHKATQQGFVRDPIDVRYLLDYERTDRDGFRKNGFQRDNTLTYAFGARPDFKNGMFLYGGLRDRKYGDPGPDRAEYEANDTNRLLAFEIDAGYNYRLGNKNNLLFNFRYSLTTMNYTNPDPNGSGLNDAQLSLITAFGLDGARSYLNQGVFDFTNESVLQGPWSSPYYGTDSTGIARTRAAQIGAVPVSANIPGSIDPNSSVSRKGVREGYNYQLKHLFQLGEQHQISWGAEYSPIHFKVSSTYASSMAGAAIFREDYLLWGGLGVPTGWLTIPAMHIENYDLTLNQDSTYVGAYVNDRWKPFERLLIDAGLFYEYFSNRLNTNRDFNPRLGIALKLHRDHIIRGAYQKRTLEAFDMTLAPVTTAGLFFDWIQLYPGSRVTDYQATLESRWNDRLFTSVGYEIRDYKNPDFEFNLYSKRNRAEIVTAAANAILTDSLGFYVRYKHTDSKNHDEPSFGKTTPLVPKHSLAAGVVFVSPRHYKVALSTNYVAGQYGDDANNYRMPDFFTTDLSASWEPLRKRVLLSLDLKNIFDRKYESEMLRPAAGRSVFLKMEYRF
ncbi:MAG TPA: tetratricopeptide repeat protein [Desulfuromonadales bacterium]|nr:tetratricopeptide repeat protein [Desulfuromonadales bacterium]